MESANIQNIAILRNLIEESAGRKMKTPSDFIFLTGVIAERTKKPLSEATLKRVWGYVEGYETMRESTLSILAQCVGYRDWDDFVENYCSSSDALSSKAVLSPSLKADEVEAGELVSIAWNPGRECLLRHLGDGRYEVLQAANSKLAAGDTFHCAQFIIGYPCYLDNLVQHGNGPFMFVIGNKGGLTRAEKVREN